MRVTVPIYVQQTRVQGSPAPTFSVRPLFFLEPSHHGAVLARVLAKVQTTLRSELDKLCRQADQRELAERLTDPLLDARFLKESITLRRRTASVRTLVASFEVGGVRMGFFPELENVWFDIPRGKPLIDRAKEALTEHLLKIEKDSPDTTDDELFGSGVTNAYVTTIELQLSQSPKLPKKDDRPMFLLGPAEPADGETELHRVGRSLDAEYPDRLDRALLREAEVAEVTFRITEPARWPILLLGPRGAGKTTVLHEVVRRRIEEGLAQGRRRRRRQVWLISPQRLVSGMSYVGQWEDRLLAILKYAAKKEQILYFDDLLGLYFAGQSGMSSLSVADVLRPFIERREVRVVAEITPDALRLLRERDRAMADLFDIIPIREPEPDVARRMILGVQRQLEDRHRCIFDVDALPAVLDLQRRYVRDMAMPGKAAELLRRLAASNERRRVGRDQVLLAFEAFTGLSALFADTRVQLRREDIVVHLARQVVAQPAAIAAMADAVSIAKARLNDVGRPLAAFLFLGPTGVGKTECAKALARYLFQGGTDPDLSDADLSQRLIRFDMNEFLDAGSAGRLIGTPGNPEGLLTSAVRRQPFSVLLLDEIEKAHPSVFDLLLAVIGEGRMTDARGRTADFTNCIIVMTSNLGVRDAEASFGLGRSAEQTEGSASANRYVDAARRFFRPEFFNRIDRVVPFARLDRESIADIARRLLDGLLRRPGLASRRCIMRIDPVALDRLVEAGFHPKLGARALKREIERRIAMPVARKLATMSPGEPTVINVAADAAAVETGGVAVQVVPLRPVEPVVADRSMLLDARWFDPKARIELADDLLDLAEDALVRLEQQAETLGSVRGQSHTQFSSGDFAYLAIREQAKQVGQLIASMDQAVEQAIKPQRPGSTREVEKRQVLLTRKSSGASAWAQLMDPTTVTPPVESADAVGNRLRALADDLLDELALLSAMVEGAIAARASGDGSRFLLILRSWNAPKARVVRDADAYTDAFGSQFGAQVALVGPKDRAASELPAHVQALVVDLPGAQRVLRSEAGLHVHMNALGGLELVEALLVPLAEGADAISAAAETLRRHTGTTDQRVVRGYNILHRTVDFATGNSLLQSWPDGLALRKLILSALPLPAELTADEGRDDGGQQ